MGKPGAIRAAGSACGDNHLAIPIPCHRVVRSDGGLGGYAYGLERKKALLRKEGGNRSEEHTSELQSLMRISYAVFCLKKTQITTYNNEHTTQNQTRLSLIQDVNNQTTIRHRHKK